MKPLRLIGFVLLWLIFIALVGYLGHLSLKSCGVRILGYQWSWCTEETTPDLTRLNALQDQLHILMQMAGEQQKSCPPPPPEMPVAKAPPPEPEAPEPPSKHCARPEDRSYIVLALDYSGSMAIPADMDSAAVSKIEKQAERGGLLGKAADFIYAQLKKKNGRKRLDDLKESVAQVARQLDAETDIGLVAFSGCDDVADLGNYRHSERSRLIAKTNSLTADQATAAAKALELALQKVKQKGGGRIILVGDGKDTCEGDPCAVARAHPEVEIDVVSLGGGDALACVAKASGGKWIEPEQLGANLQSIMVDLGNNAARALCE
ncbi:VWA domain-containing protein [uncultured Cohaesibacter sp.]|uniref:VWA domain-containing protein n=1 Tax=uncultured Cohaesibacter sp. TaxID=1002546 RepID=UPI002AAA6729|nr:VWA domain-containing protein [uncultured Cohaesibacter sp.]